MVKALALNQCGSRSIPRLGKKTRRHMCVEFVIYSTTRSSLRVLRFPSPQKPTFYLIFVNSFAFFLSSPPGTGTELFTKYDPSEDPSAYAAFSPCFESRAKAPVQRKFTPGQILQSQFMANFKTCALRNEEMKNQQVTEGLRAGSVILFHKNVLKIVWM